MDWFWLQDTEYTLGFYATLEDAQDAARRHCNDEYGNADEFNGEDGEWEWDYDKPTNTWEGPGYMIQELKYGDLWK